MLHKELDEPGARAESPRGSLAIVGISWAWAIFNIGSLHGLDADDAPGQKQPSVADFTKYYGPWIILATVLVPLVVASVINSLQHAQALRPDRAGSPTHAGARMRSITSM